ncbi:hypothetical protein SYNPS1DRAFT_23459 [Syncephalis pseudoplumigaleata]|uniref:Uncharacterized protein n=1 Tax=Syncephalis pseudoplumigaleata TaxID=1712513 RepID=A0A4P9YX37_9FUNG|nr:hypothetical protein SYNPS1DRAFT_23459 [Syncephalis pseudoplumigaleata]|eukprot:RKP24458.1 hypothetical protein SYNPS1DRAFT_23459 [Syncephalis pseudoplumigaleata]
MINKRPIPPRKHIELRPGDHVKFGESTRTHILQGPDIREQLKAAAAEALHAEQQKQAAQSSEGTDSNWGFAEDITDDGSLIRAAMERGDGVDGAMVPAARASKRASYEDDPKKALRHYLEASRHWRGGTVKHRGYAMEFEMDDEFAQGFHTFTAREAERAAALDAMEKLDAHGELATEHDPHGEKRKAKQARTKQAPVENYASLVEKRRQAEEKIEQIARRLAQIASHTATTGADGNGGDDLDAYMAGVQSNIDEKEASKLRKEMATLEEKAAKDEAMEEDNTVEWVPPKNQSGDGRTSLNDKYGY